MWGSLFILLFFTVSHPHLSRRASNMPVQNACNNTQLLARPCIHRRLCRARSVSGFTCVAEMTSHLATELYVAFASSLTLLIRSPNSYFCFSSKLQQTNGMLWATSVLFAKSRILHSQNLLLDCFPSWTHRHSSWRPYTRTNCTCFCTFLPFFTYTIMIRFLLS